jgi:hypothetical protein
MQLTTGASADIAVIWDEDHDARVIKALETIYREGFLGSILMIGERQGTLNAIVSERVEDPTLLKLLEDKLLAVAQHMEGDPWTSTLHKLDSPEHEIIEDDNDKICLYLKNLKMLWRLGVNLTPKDRIRARRAETRKATLSNLTDEQIVAIVRSVPGTGDPADVARFGALLNAAAEIKAKREKEAVATQKPEDPVTNPSRKIRLVE